MHSPLFSNFMTMKISSLPCASYLMKIRFFLKVVRLLKSDELEVKIIKRHQSSKIATPGNVFPSIYSNKAPPPVET